MGGDAHDVIGRAAMHRGCHVSASGPAASVADERDALHTRWQGLAHYTGKMTFSMFLTALDSLRKLRHARAVLQRALCAGLLLTVAAMPAVAQWKWRDAKGQAHASDTPPPRDIPEKNIIQRPDLAARAAPAASAAPPAAEASASATLKPATDPQLEEQRRRIEQDKLARDKAEADKQLALRRENCQRARENLKTLDSGQRIARVKADGEREILSDEQRATEVRRTREAMATDCR
jgi:hypothetical protein